MLIYFMLFTCSLFSQWEKVLIPRYNDFICITKFNDQYFIGTDGDGIISSTDDGASWKSLNNGINIPYSYLVINSFYNDDDLYVCTSLGLYKFISSEQKWELIHTEPTISFSKEGDTFIAGQDYEGIMTSFDGGKSWKTDQSHPFFNCRSAIFLNEKILVPSTDGLYVSKDNALTWSLADNYYYNNILQKGDSLIASRIDDVYISTNDGESWNPFEGSYLTGRQVIFAENKYFHLTAYYVLCINEQLERWVNPNFGLQYVEGVWYKSINVIDNYLYLCTTEGLLKRPLKEFDYPDMRINDQIKFSKSPAVGEVAYSSFSISNNGLDTLRISKIYSDNPNFQLDRYSVAVPPNWGYGVNLIYTASDPGLDSTTIYIESNSIQGNTSFVIKVEAIPVNYSLEQNYPNPFNPTTRINYIIEKTEHVRLEIFNSIGQRIVTLVDQIQSGGSKFVMFDASSFAAGIYYYRLNAGDYSITKKMVLMK